MSSISDEYETLEIIGKGSFGTVRKVRQRSDGAIYVRKEIEYHSMNTQERNQLISELRILRELNHPNIVKYYRHDHVMERKSIHIYMEYCDGGDLGQVISNFKKNKESVPEEFVWQVLVQTLLALHRCHYGIEAKKVNLFGNANDEVEPSVNSENVVIHRDIKPDNIFLLNSGKTIKVGDFGLAKMITSQNDFAKTYVGTPYYMSPEVLMDNPYDPVCDVWSLGCVLFELCTLQPPFQAKTHLQLQSKIKKGIIPEVPDTYSPQLISIIRECITVDPEMRPSCFDLLQLLPIRFLRKEMELKEISISLSDYQKQLVSKNDELMKKESFIKSLESKVMIQKDKLQEEFSVMQKKYSMQKKQLEDELIEEFEQRKKIMDQEAEEVRLNYQREFKFVVEQEVQQRVKEIIGSKSSSDLSRKKSDPQAKVHNYDQSPSKLRGPKEYFDEQPSGRRTPLKIRSDYENAQTTRMQGNNYRKRITDELERLSLDKRNLPEFEELYWKNYRH